jgi:prepilin-type N-terminal cleavage/methylation domain-containing protein
MNTSHTTQRGFTLVETLLAVLILAACIAALMNLVASGFFSVRYAKNQITANMLMQESLEYVRNTRDTRFQNNDDWTTWVGYYTQAKCFTASGCIVDPLWRNPVNPPISVVACPTSGCGAVWYFPDSGFYGYGDTSFNYPFSKNNGYATIFKRTVTFAAVPGSEEVFVTVTVTWSDGNVNKKIDQSMVIANWSS